MREIEIESGERERERERENMLRHLYPGHRPTSLVQKLVLASQSAVTALVDPTRDDAVRSNVDALTQNI